MSQATIPTSLSGSSTAPGFSASSASSLHPQIKLTLSYLDSSLEDELMRYRKARSGKRVAPSSVRVMQGSQKLASKADVELTRFVPIDQMPKSPQPGSLNSPSTQTSAPDGPPDGPRVLATEFLDQLAVIPEDGARNQSVTNNDPADHSASDSHLDDYSAVEISYSLNDLLDNPSIDHLSREQLSRSIDYGNGEGAEDYLESSEELLRSLAQEEADADSERSGLENLMTPFGIGSMLLLLMASGMFGYLVMNPATFASIGSAFSNFFKSSPAPIAASVETETPSLTTTGIIPTGSEFMDLSLKNLAVMGTQNNLSGLPSLPGLLPTGKPSDRPVTTVLGGSAVTGKSSAPTKTASRTANPSAIGAAASGGGLFQGGNSSLGNGGIFKDPAPQAEDTQPIYTPPTYKQPAYTSPVYVAPRRSAAPRRQEPAYRAPVQSAPPQPVRTVPMELPPAPSTPTSIPPVPVESAAPQTPTYRVEAPYTGDRALEKAQQADPGAYFRNGENGAVVQMGGSYSSREEAEAKAQSLKKQGFDGVEVVK